MGIFICAQVNQDEAPQKGNSDAGLDGIAGALARALQERSKAIHSSGMFSIHDMLNTLDLYMYYATYFLVFSDEEDESGSDFEDDEDEWDD